VVRTSSLIFPPSTQRPFSTEQTSRLGTSFACVIIFTVSPSPYRTVPSICYHLTLAYPTPSLLSPRSGPRSTSLPNGLGYRSEQTPWIDPVPYHHPSLSLFAGGLYAAISARIPASQYATVLYPTVLCCSVLYPDPASFFLVLFRLDPSRIGGKGPGYCVINKPDGGNSPTPFIRSLFRPIARPLNLTHANTGQYLPKYQPPPLST
jgi:hypothetical protein